MPVDFQSYTPDDGDDGPSIQFTEESNAYKILQFLVEDPDTGYTPKEISEATGVPRGSVGTTLARLEDNSLVKHKEPYWAAGEDDRLASFSAAIHSNRAIDDRFGEEDWGDWEEHAVDPREERDAQ